MIVCRLILTNIKLDNRRYQFFYPFHLNLQTTGTANSLTSRKLSTQDLFENAGLTENQFR